MKSTTFDRIATVVGAAFAVVSTVTLAALHTVEGTVVFLFLPNLNPRRIERVMRKESDSKWAMRLAIRNFSYVVSISR